MVIRFCLPSRFLLLLLVALPVACTTTTIDEKRVGSASVGSGDAIVVLGRRHSSDYETEPDFIRCIGRGVASGGAHVVPEIEFLNGEILRRAHTLGIAAPINQALTVMVRLAEQRQA